MKYIIETKTAGCWNFIGYTFTDEATAHAFAEGMEEGAASLFHSLEVRVTSVSDNQGD